MQTASLSREREQKGEVNDVANTSKPWKYEILVNKIRTKYENSDRPNNSIDC